MAGTFSNPSLLRRPLLPAWPPPVPTFGVQPWPLCPPRSSLRLLHDKIHFLPDCEPADCLGWEQGEVTGVCQAPTVCPGLDIYYHNQQSSGIVLEKSLSVR